MTAAPVVRRRIVAVVGPGAEVDDALLGAAADVGRGVAAAGFVLVTGGLGGVMGAASGAASAAGGIVVGMLPGNDPAAANDGVDIAVATGMGELRNALVVAAADAVIAVGGSWGTLSEVALARRAGKPVVCIRGWRVVGPDADDDVVVADSADAAVREVASRLRDN